MKYIKHVASTGLHIERISLKTKPGFLNEILVRFFAFLEMTYIDTNQVQFAHILRRIKT